jgi:chemotaxis protein MotB
MKRIAKYRQGSSETNYWQSYSDMMAALLLIFVLIIAVSIVALNDYKEKLAEQNEELLVRQELLEKQSEEYLKLKQELEEKQAQIDRIIGVKQEIIEALNTELSKQDIEITIDQQTGAIVFDASILYDRSQSELKEEGRECLDQFLPIYIGVLFSDEFKEDVAEIIIEGHTDTESGYMYNLGLSQQRALSVVEYCLSGSSLSAEQKEQLRSIITANGRSFSTPVYDEDGNVDSEKSRRVEVKFRLKDEEMILELQQILEGGES